MKKYGGIQKNNQKSAKAFAFLALFFMFFLFPSNTQALTEQQRLNQINQQLQETKRKLAETKEERRSLQGEVASFDRQIGDVQAQIASTSAQIARLNQNISSTNQSIRQAEAKLAETRGQLAEYLRVSYEDGQVSTIELIAGSSSFSEFVNKTEYKTSIQLKIKDIADSVVNLKGQLENHKKTQQSRKIQSENLKTEQAQNQAELATQRSSKNYLLSVTRGDEAEYQRLVARLRREYAALQESIWSKQNGGKYVSLGKVRKGQIIGYIGNTGFSSGPHLHFEIRTASQAHRNPFSYIGNGYFINPVPGVRVSQGYGTTSWWAYNFHTGVDFADGGRGTPVRASADGDIIVRVSGKRNTYPNGPLSYGNYVKIRHTNGMYSLYAHLR